jgi:hypothetical protein
MDTAKLFPFRTVIVLLPWQRTHHNNVHTTTPRAINSTQTQGGQHNSTTQD